MSRDVKKKVTCWCFICGNKTTLNIFVERLEKGIESHLGGCEKCGRLQLHVFNKDKVLKKKPVTKDICPVCNKEATIRSTIGSNGMKSSYIIHIYDCLHAQLKLYKKGQRDPIIKQIEVDSIQDTKLVETLLFNKFYGIGEDNEDR